jgi:hypothetical protein
MRDTNETQEPETRSSTPNSKVNSRKAKRKNLLA